MAGSVINVDELILEFHRSCNNPTNSSSHRIDDVAFPTSKADYNSKVGNSGIIVESGTQV